MPGQGELASHTVQDPSKIQWSLALPSTAFAGLLAAVLMVIPLGAFGLGMLAAGALSVLFYRRRSPMTNLSPGMGARLGAASGAMGFGIFAIFTALAAGIFGKGGQLRAALLDAIQQSASRSSDPQAQEMLEWLKTPEGLALMITLGMIFTLMVFVILSSAGGALTAALMRKREHR